MKNSRVHPTHWLNSTQARAEGIDASEVAFEGMPHNVFFEDAKPEECSRAICGFVAEC